MTAPLSTEHTKSSNYSSEEPNTQQTPHHMLHFNAIWPWWSERHADVSIFEFFHISSKKRHHWQSNGWDNDPVFTRMRKGVGVSEFKTGCSMVRTNQACGLRTRIVVNVENHYWGTVIYCTQPSRASLVKSKGLFLYNNTVMNKGLNSVCNNNALMSP